MSVLPEPEPVTITFSPPIKAAVNGTPCRILALHWRWGWTSGPPSHAVVADASGHIEFTHAQGLTLPADWEP